MSTTATKVASTARPNVPVADGPSRDEIEILEGLCGVLGRFLPIAGAAATLLEHSGAAETGPATTPGPTRRVASSGAGTDGTVPAAVIPVSIDGEILGTVELYARPGIALDDREVAAAEECASTAARCLRGLARQRRAERTVEQLRHALAARVVIEQAKGVLAHRERIDPDEAFERMRRHARDHNLRVQDIARQVLDLALARSPR